MVLRVLPPKTKSSNWPRDRVGESQAKYRLGDLFCSVGTSFVFAFLVVFAVPDFLSAQIEAERFTRIHLEFACAKEILVFCRASAAKMKMGRVEFFHPELVIYNCRYGRCFSQKLPLHISIDEFSYYCGKITIGFSYMLDWVVFIQTINYVWWLLNI